MSSQQLHKLVNCQTRLVENGAQGLRFEDLARWQDQARAPNGLRKSYATGARRVRGGWCDGMATDTAHACAARGAPPGGRAAAPGGAAVPGGDRAPGGGTPCVGDPLAAAARRRGPAGVAAPPRARSPVPPHARVVAPTLPRAPAGAVAAGFETERWTLRRIA